MHKVQVCGYIKGRNISFNRLGGQAASISAKGKAGGKEACRKLTSSKGINGGNAMASTSKEPAETKATVPKQGASLDENHLKKQKTVNLI